MPQQDFILRVRDLLLRLAAGVAIALLLSSAIGAARADQVPCPGADKYLPDQPIRQGGGAGNSQPDLLVDGECIVVPGKTYYYGNINIIKNGVLAFTETHKDGTTPGGESSDLWATAIIIEGDGTPKAANGGVMSAGTAAAPYGSAGNHKGTLTIHLYGPDKSNGKPDTDPGQGTLCQSPQKENDTGPCGIPWDRWVDNGKTQFTDLPGGVTDYFYRYGPLRYDGKGDAFSVSPYNPGSQGYFGYKVLAVSYGGSLQLFGYKGTPNGTPANTDAGTSWIRLKDGADLAKGAQSLTLDSAPNGKWQADDEVVVTTTDYLPGHSEQLTITGVTDSTVNFGLCAASAGGLCGTPAAGPGPGLAWQHSGTRYKLDLGGQQSRLNLNQDLVDNGVESRAAVALLTRSIRIVSGGDTPGAAFPAVGTGYYFGGHTIFRQGFKSVQVQGVEFAQLGQGGRIGRYPVHFHMARRTPPNTFVTDSSVNESMTRWFVLHSTQNVTLARNVGYLSIGDGYFLEDGTEADNALYSNIGIFARAAVQNAQNPRRVPGILAYTPAGASVALDSDVYHPTVFWIANGWNDFIGNMAAGAGTCGACYWLLPSLNTDMPDVPNGDMHMKWTGYAGLQTQINTAGATPLKSFYKNYCSASMNSFETVGAIDGCLGLVAPDGDPNQIRAVKSIAPPNEPGLMYYPNLLGNRLPTVCANADCVGAVPCSNTDPKNCAVTVLDNYTTMFHWAEQNFAAVWLRPDWFLMTDSVIADVQTAGLTFVSGGDYTRASVPEGYWALAGHDVFIGQTNPDNPLTIDQGPFNPKGLSCRNLGSFCVNIDEGVSFPLSNFAVNQRLFNLYDGPTYEDSNAYLDITQRACNSLDSCIYYNKPGVRRTDPGNTTGTDGYMPNAAIAWKQPNGFFYPPAFHSKNLYFSNVDIRHYVIAPLFIPRTYLTNENAVRQAYVSAISGGYFTGYTDIDRQTELNDDDGTLTGLANTISVNEDSFFNAPVATPECDSNIDVSPKFACSEVSTTAPAPTARTSPYDYFSTVIYPGCAVEDVSITACGSTQPPPPPPDNGPWLPKFVTGPPGDTQYVQYDKIAGTAGDWSADCGGPFCFGVKMYRQFLTGIDSGALKDSTREWSTWYTDKCDKHPSDPECDWPFERMAGQGFWQRSILTANNGTYYIDTTPSKDDQTKSDFAGRANDPAATYVDCKVRERLGVIGNCQPRSVSVFQAGQTYYVMLLFAKSTTRVTYQIYVGPGFDENSLKPVAVTANVNHPLVPSSPPASWPAASTWLTHLPVKNDILTVTLDLTSFGPKSVLDPAAKISKLCQPKPFCDWNGDSCGCVLSPSDPRVIADAGFKARCDSACSSWAVKDLDFPPDGMIGFAFTMGSGFVADSINRRPSPAVFTGAGWPGAFAATTIPPDSATGGACHYPSPLPGEPGCPVSDPPP
jgi:hypothetical protein